MQYGTSTAIIAINRGHFAPVINCQRNLIFKMADKSYRSQGKRIVSQKIFIKNRNITSGVKARSSLFLWIHFTQAF